MREGSSHLHGVCGQLKMSLAVMAILLPPLAMVKVLLTTLSLMLLQAPALTALVIS